MAGLAAPARGQQAGCLRVARGFWQVTRSQSSWFPRRCQGCFTVLLAPLFWVMPVRRIEPGFRASPFRLSKGLRGTAPGSLGRVFSQWKGSPGQALSLLRAVNCGVPCGSGKGRGLSAGPGRSQAATDLDQK